jgi:aspartate 1-decarboxylase
MHLTETNLEYDGSITIDKELMEMADIWPYERVQVLNYVNGNRLETYVIPGERSSGLCCLNGPAALKGKVGDRITVISYTLSNKPVKPTIIATDSKNKFKKRLS